MMSGHMRSGFLPNIFKKVDISALWPGTGVWEDRERILSAEEIDQVRQVKFQSD